jgi:hypothetical protein
MAMQSALDPSVRETHMLIGSDKVHATAVYRSNGDIWRNWRVRRSSISN